MSEETPPSEISSSPDSSHKDRRTGLVIFGIFQILLGFVCFGFAALIPIGSSMGAQAGAEPMPLRVMIPGLMIYACWGVMFIWLGIGSTQYRRWARALTLILSWVWLVTGIIMMPMMVWLMPKIMSDAATTGGEIPEGMIGVIIVIQLAVMGFIFIVLPGVLVLFYRSRHVKATCETQDAVPRWTDKCPLPLLAVATLMWATTAMLLGLSLGGMAIVPLFGTLLTDLPGSILMGLVAGFIFWIGLSWYRSKIIGWYMLIGMMIVFGISNVLTWLRVDFIQIYVELDYPEDQIEMIRQQDWLSNDFIIWSSVAWILPVLLYALWAKRFFRLANDET